MRLRERLVMAIILAAVSVPAFAQFTGTSEPGLVEWKHGIVIWKSEDDHFAGRFDTRAFLNGAYFFENKNKLSNGTHLRKARFALKTVLWKKWYAEWDIDVAEGVVEAKDMYLTYMGFKNSEIQFGQFKEPFGLEILTSSRYLPFPERAYLGLGFKLGRRMGIGYTRWGARWNVRAALYGQAFDTKKNKIKDETGGGIGVRLVGLPLKSDHFLVHTGASVNWTTPDDETKMVKFKAEPETKIGDVEILDTGALLNVRYTRRVGLEGAAIFRNFHLQTEYAWVDVKRLGSLPTLQFSGGYLYLLWTITGESRHWLPSQGEFSQLIPRNEQKGAWELGFRYSYMNLSDTHTGILGGRANNYSAVVNWYANANMVFQINYTLVRNSPNATGNGFVGGDHFSYIQFMTKYFF